MQIEPPETIHFPIHSLQELQEQRGGLRVSALGSAAPPAHGRVEPRLNSVDRGSGFVRSKPTLHHTASYLAGLGGRIPVRLRVSRRAALVALVGSGRELDDR